MILKKLNDFLLELDSEYNINSGGCCFIAFCIATQLEKYSIRYKIVILGDEGLCSKELRSNIKCNDGFYPTRDNTANHYLLQVKNTYINLGDFNIRSYAISKTSCIKPLEIYNMYKSGWWNPDYDKKNNLKIYKEIKRFFKHNEKEAKNLTSSQL